MTIGCILAKKGYEVTVIAPQASLRDVVDLLAAKHFGAIVVASASGEMKGILSERDVVRAIARHGCDALDDPVSSFMTAEVVTADEGDSVIAAAQRMSTGRFRHLPVTKGGKLIGIVSVGDLIKYRLERMEHEQNALRDYIASA